MLFISVDFVRDVPNLGIGGTPWEKRVVAGVGVGESHLVQAGRRGTDMNRFVDNVCRLGRGEKKRVFVSGNGN